MNLFRLKKHVPFTVYQTACCANIAVLMASTILFAESTSAQSSPAPHKATVPHVDVVSRTQVAHSSRILKRFRFDEAEDAWLIRNPDDLAADASITNRNLEIHSSGGLCSRRQGEKEFRIYSLASPGVYRFRCYGTNVSDSLINGHPRFAYLRNSNAWISQRSALPEKSNHSVSENSTLLDRNVHAITWTADKRNVVYCKAVEGSYQLISYSLADDDYIVLLEFPTSEVRPLLANDSAHGVYLVTAGNTIRRISLPISAVSLRFDSINAISVLYGSSNCRIVNVFETAVGELHVQETEPDGVEYETILSISGAADQQPEATKSE